MSFASVGFRGPGWSSIVAYAALLFRPGSVRQTLRGVVLTFSVRPPAVAIRMASWLHLRPWVFQPGPWRFSAGGLPGSCLSVVVPLVALSHPRGSRSRPRPFLRIGSRSPFRRHVLPPVRFAASTTRPTRGIHFPAVPYAPNNSVSRGAASSRDSTPAWSAFAVFHGLDGLILPGPCGLFQPLTPMKFDCPVPRKRGVEIRVAGSRFGGLTPCEHGV